MAGATRTTARHLLNTVNRINEAAGHGPFTLDDHDAVANTGDTTSLKTRALGQLDFWRTVAKASDDVDPADVTPLVVAQTRLLLEAHRPATVLEPVR